jgi:hypothetical protein
VVDAIISTKIKILLFCWNPIILLLIFFFNCAVFLYWRNSFICVLPCFPMLVNFVHSLSWEKSVNVSEGVCNSSRLAYLFSNRNVLLYTWIDNSFFLYLFTDILICWFVDTKERTGLKSTHDIGKKEGGIVSSRWGCHPSLAVLIVWNLDEFQWALKGSTFLTFGPHVVEVSLYMLDFFYGHLLVQLKMYFMNDSFFKRKWFICL